MPSFEKKVKEEILKTGLPTEIQVTQTLKKAGWVVFNEYPYLDRDENKIRTLDITAENIFKKPDSTEVTSGCKLFIECKKSTSALGILYRGRSFFISKFEYFKTGA